MQLTKIFFALMAAGAVAAAPTANVEARDDSITQEEVDALTRFANFVGLKPEDNIFYKDGKLETTPELTEYLKGFASNTSDDASNKRDLGEHEAPEKRLFFATTFAILRGVFSKWGGSCSSRCGYGGGGGYHGGYGGGGGYRGGGRYGGGY